MNELLSTLEWIKDNWIGIAFTITGFFIGWVLFKWLCSIGKEEDNKVHPGKVVDIEEWELKMRNSGLTKKEVEGN